MLSLCVFGVKYKIYMLDVQLWQIFGVYVYKNIVVLVSLLHGTLLYLYNCILTLLWNHIKTKSRKVVRDKLLSIINLNYFSCILLNSWEHYWIDSCQVILFVWMHVFSQHVSSNLFRAWVGEVYMWTLIMSTFPYI